MIEVHVNCKSVTRTVKLANDAIVRDALIAAQEAGLNLGEDVSLLEVSDHYAGGKLTLDSPLYNGITLDCTIRSSVS